MLKYLEELLAKYPNFYQIFIPIIISVILFIFKIPQKFVQHYLQKHRKRKDIFKNKQYIQDNVYLKREMEIQEILQELIKEQELTIVYGALGRGKTITLKKLHDRVLDKKEKFIKFSLYIDLEKKNLIDELEKITEIKIVSPLDFYNWLNSLLGRKKCLIILDNIAPAQYANIINFFLDNYHVQYKIIIGLNYINPKESSQIEIKNFDTKQVAELAKLRRLDIDEDNLSRVFTLTQGIPVYVDYLFKTNRCPLNYELVEVISSQLAICTAEEKDLLQSIALNKILYHDFTEELFSTFDIGLIMSLSSKGLIQFEEITKNIELNPLIAEQYLSHLKNEYVYVKLLEYYKIHSQENFLELSLRLPITIKNDYSTFIQILKQLYNNEKYQYLLYLGEIILQNGPQAFFDFDKIINVFFDCFISSILKIGDYNYAKNIIDKINDCDVFDSNLIYRNVRTEAISYKINFCDLLHLTNSFQDAIENLELLLETSSVSSAQQERCNYLILHCKRHIGKDLSQISKNFRELSNNSQEIYYQIRSLYSAFSIDMFQGKKHLKRKFAELENKIDSLQSGNEIVLFAQRHYIIFYRRCCNNLEKAEKLLIKNIKSLENSKLRILYDYYFEAGELYREKFYFQSSKNNYKASYDFYDKAIAFSKNVGDTNLYHNAMIGRILLQEQHAKVTQEDLNFIYRAIQTEPLLNKVQFQLAYYYLTHDYDMLDQLSKYARLLEYYDTSNIAQKLSKKQSCFIPLTVM